jgi:hypothetical protein
MLCPFLGVAKRKVSLLGVVTLEHPQWTLKPITCNHENLVRPNLSVFPTQNIPKLVTSPPKKPSKTKFQPENEA